MATGYTHKLLSHKMSGAEFLKECAKSFLIEYKEDVSHHTPIERYRAPQKNFSKNYHATCVDMARAELARLEAMSLEERIVYGHEKLAEAIKNNEQRQAEHAETMALYDKAEAEVLAWKPPTERHEGLKEFALEQIRSSRNFDSQLYLDPIKEPAEYHADAIGHQRFNREYHEEELAKALDTKDDRNEWVAALLDSLEAQHA